MKQSTLDHQTAIINQPALDHQTAIIKQPALDHQTAKLFKFTSIYMGYKILRMEQNCKKNYFILVRMSQMLPF
jgi:hypothetical protein